MNPQNHGECYQFTEDDSETHGHRWPPCLRFAQPPRQIWDPARPGARLMALGRLSGFDVGWLVGWINVPLISHQQSREPGNDQRDGETT